MVFCFLFFAGALGEGLYIIFNSDINCGKSVGWLLWARWLATRPTQLRKNENINIEKNLRGVEAQGAKGRKNRKKKEKQKSWGQYQTSKGYKKSVPGLVLHTHAQIEKGAGRGGLQSTRSRQIPKSGQIVMPANINSSSQRRRSKSKQEPEHVYWDLILPYRFW